MPPITAARPTARLPCGATRAASGVMIDQKIECVSATPTRAANSVSNVSTQGTTKWQIEKTKSSTSSNLRRSNLAVTIVRGSDMIATTKA